MLQLSLPRIRYMTKPSLMNKRYTLQIPDPCSQKWSEMTPQADGRHCDQCDKVIRDFTSYTDAQILSAIENEKVCGRFRPDQLNRTYKRHDESSKRWISVFATTLALASSSSAESQIITPTPTDTIHDSDTLKVVEVTNKNQIILRGNVSDKETGEKLFQVYITVENTEYKTASNFDGDFELAISEELVENGFTLKFTSYGYDGIKLIFAPNEYKGTFINMECTAQYMGLLGDVHIVEHKRWWEFWK
ncbi:carboxypeptidase-like regulatory domain-containing protein [Phaeocystidibacter marisrubri]|uniref:Carboxypeptidase-like regulatory domain-containing protein n=2 Tax=Phaeocystidibacter marisrubri TaxID=1577780 RepID=A0A6L3ZKA8_9FLAO|nr:carboxypeptidase-like regulatory domain-containing protein [Phaeocystidibacter marisrubri]